jgi:chromosome segregation ATPase
MSARDKASTIIAEYRKELSLIQDKINQSEARLQDLFLEIRYIEEKEIPEAIKRRVLTGDRSHETKLRKILEKLQKEREEKNQDLIVLQTAISNCMQQKTDEIQKIRHLIKEELKIISEERYERIMDYKKDFKDAIISEIDILHLYAKLESELQQIEVNSGRRKYVQSDFPWSLVTLSNLAIDRSEIISLVKRSK